jgi:hypothetical protein
VRFAGTLKSYQEVFKFSKSISRFTGMLNLLVNFASHIYQMVYPVYQVNHLVTKKASVGTEAVGE